MNRALAFQIGVVSSVFAGGAMFVPACAAGDANDKAAVTKTDAAPIEAAIPDAGEDADAGPPPSLGGRSFVAQNVFLGDTDLDGGADPNAWAQFGTDIDGKDTQADSSDVCTPVEGATSATQIDGAGGIDNSFGKNVLPVFAQLGATGFSSELTTSIAIGGPSLMVNLKGLTDALDQTASNLDAQLVSVVHPDRVPTWTPTDLWQVYASGLVDGTIPSGGKARFPTSSIASGVWSSGGVGDISLTLAFGTASLDVVVHHATVSFIHSSAHEATSGIVSGVVKTSELLTSVEIVLAQSGACVVSTELLPQIAAASDIMQYGTNAPGQTCDGISIGMGFNAMESAPPNQTAADPTPGAGCP
jgi:hypothetical protein